MGNRPSHRFMASQAECGFNEFSKIFQNIIDF